MRKFDNERKEDDGTWKQGHWIVGGLSPQGITVDRHHHPKGTLQWSHGLSLVYITTSSGQCCLCFKEVIIKEAIDIWEETGVKGGKNECRKQIGVKKCHVYVRNKYVALISGRHW